jgi:hypothetical protein
MQMTEFGGFGEYLAPDVFETPNAVYDTFGDDVAVDGYQDGALSEGQLEDSFEADANFQSFDDTITGDDL